MWWDVLTYTLLRRSELGIKTVMVLGVAAHALEAAFVAWKCSAKRISAGSAW